MPNTAKQNDFQKAISDLYQATEDTSIEQFLNEFSSLWVKAYNAPKGRSEYCLAIDSALETTDWAETGVGLGNMEATQASFKIPEAISDNKINLIFGEISSLAAHPVSGKQVSTTGDECLLLEIPKNSMGNDTQFIVSVDNLLTPMDRSVSVLLREEEADEASKCWELFLEFVTKPNIYANKVLHVAINPYYTDIKIIKDDTSGKIVVSEETTREMDAFLSVVGTKRDTLLSLGLPIKRGMLFEGPPGTGKTTMARKLSHRFVNELGGTTIIPSADSDISEVMKFAKSFDKSFIILEDVESVTGRRGESAFTSFLNAVDGVDRQRDMLFLATTNNSKLLDKAVLRPGRMDKKIVFDFFTKEQVAQLLENRFGQLNLDSDVVADALKKRKDRITGADIEVFVSSAILYNDVLTTETAVKFAETQWEPSIEGADYT